jgi:hypothetical protein
MASVRIMAAPSFDPADAQWIAHRYERIRDEVHFRFVPREMHGEFPFLTEEYVGALPAARLGRAEAVSVARPTAAPLRIIFHSAFCASTLLTRALDRPGLAMGLSEPTILNDIVGIRQRREAEPKRIAQLLDEAMLLLGRPWDAGEAVVVKPSNILNPLAAAMLALRPDARAVLMHAPLPVFLASVARKGMWCRLWARELLERLLQDGVVNLGFEAQEWFRLTDLQVAAVGWIAQHRLFHDIKARFGDRVLAVDSEAMLANAPVVLETIASHLALGEAGIGPSLAGGPAFGRHSKSGSDFSAADRSVERAAALAAHGEEIEKVTVWAEAVASNAGIAFRL